MSKEDILGASLLTPPREFTKEEILQIINDLKVDEVRSLSFDCELGYPILYARGLRLEIKPVLHVQSDNYEVKVENELTDLEITLDELLSKKVLDILNQKIYLASGYKYDPAITTAMASNRRMKEEFIYKPTSNTPSLKKYINVYNVEPLPVNQSFIDSLINLVFDDANIISIMTNVTTDEAYISLVGKKLLSIKNINEIDKRLVSYTENGKTIELDLAQDTITWFLKRIVKLQDKVYEKYSLIQL